MTSVFSHIISHSATQFMWWVIGVIALAILCSRAIGFVAAIAIRGYMAVEEDSRRHVTAIQSLAWLAIVVAWIAAVVVVAVKIGIPPTIVAAVGTIIGAAVGFGSQEMIRDMLKGSIHLFEKQFSVGDWVTLTVNRDECFGQIVKVTLRTVTLVSPNEGEVTVGQGGISMVKNHDSQRAIFRVDIPLATPDGSRVVLEKIQEIVNKISDGTWQNFPLLSSGDHEALAAIDNIAMHGVRSFDRGVVIGVQGWSDHGMAAPAKRAVATIIATELDGLGIELAMPGVK